jgi:hypothetical protein
MLVISALDEIFPKLKFQTMDRTHCRDNLSHKYGQTFFKKVHKQSKKSAIENLNRESFLKKSSAHVVIVAMQTSKREKSHFFIHEY